jgi:hypothetical protein
MAESEIGKALTPNAHYQSRHIELNAGNIFAIGALSLLWWGFATWTSNVLARTDIPVISQVAVGAQNFLHAA